MGPKWLPKVFPFGPPSVAGAGPSLGAVLTQFVSDEWTFIVLKCPGPGSLVFKGEMLPGSFRIVQKSPSGPGTIQKGAKSDPKVEPKVIQKSAKKWNQKCAQKWSPRLSKRGAQVERKVKGFTP